MIVSIIIQGRFKNQVIEKSISDDQLVAWLCFTNDNGLFLEDKWIPTERIKEIQFDSEAAPPNTRRFFVEDSDDES